SVMISSVLSGRISLTEPTIVVLPTPNPPTMTIFIASSVEAGSGSRAETSSVAEGSEVVVSPEVVESSEVVESNEHLPQDVGIRLARPRAGRRVAYGDAARVEQVAQQDLHHADRQVQLRRDLDHRDGAAGQLQDLDVLRLHAGNGLALGHDQRHRVEHGLVGAGAAAGDRVEPVGALPVDRASLHEASPP